MDTGVRRSLAASAYNDRRASCERAVEILQSVRPEVRALRDVSPDLLSAERQRLDERTWKRARTWWRRTSARWRSRTRSAMPTSRPRAR
jgi:galactokinase